MHDDKRPSFGFNEIVPPVLAILLWHATMFLLGFRDTMPPGIMAKIGSGMVLLGCFFLAGPLAAITAGLFRSKSVPPAAPRAGVGPEIGESVSQPSRARSALFRRSGSRSSSGRPMDN